MFVPRGTVAYPNGPSVASWSLAQTREIAVAPNVWADASVHSVLFRSRGHIGAALVGPLFYFKGTPVRFSGEKFGRLRGACRPNMRGTRPRMKEGDDQPINERRTKVPRYIFTRIKVLNWAATVSILCRWSVCDWKTRGGGGEGGQFFPIKIRVKKVYSLYSTSVWIILVVDVSS